MTGRNDKSYVDYLDGPALQGGGGGGGWWVDVAGGKGEERVGTWDFLSRKARHMHSCK